MLNAIRAIFSAGPFVPHGHCYLWKTGLVGLHITADALIALAYFSIPIALFYFVRQRKDLPFKSIFLLFGAFIISCGTTHLLEIWTLWYPVYWLSGGVKAITALISVFTAFELLPLLPQALALPNPTDLQRLNEELQISQARFAGILDIASDAIISIDSQQRITLFNRSAEKVFGYTAEEALGQALDLLLPQRFMALHHQHISNFKERDRNTRRMGERSEIFGRRKDGTEFPAEASISKLEVADEKIFTAFLRDISDRKQAEAQLQKQQRFLRQVIDSNPSLIFVKDWEGRFTLANQALAEVYNTTPEAIIGKTDADFCVNPSDAEQYAWADRQVIQTLQPLVNLEEHFTTANGSIRCFQSTKKPLLSPDGQVRYVLGVANDITTLKQTEAALQQKTEELEVFFSSTIDLLCIASIEGYFLRLNPEWEQALGYSLLELEGKQFLSFVHPDDLKPTLAALAQLSKQQPIISFINRYRHQDGSYRCLEWRSVPRGKYIYATARDITAHKQAEEKLRQSENTKRALIQAIPDLLIRMRNDGTQLELINQECVHFVGNKNGFTDSGLADSRFPDSGLTDSGLTDSELIDTNVLDILPIQVARERLRCAEQALKTGEVQFHEYQLTVNGHHYYEEARIVPLQTDEVLMMVRDITDRKQMEQALRQSETRFRTLIEDLQVGVVVHGVRAEVLLTNSKALSLLGLTEAELLNKTSFDPDWNIIYEDGSPFPSMNHPAVQAIKTGCSVRNVIMGVFRPQHHDRVWLLVDAEPRLDEAGRVQQVICTFSDISDRQAALRDRERAKAELLQREQEFRALVENAPDIIMRLDYDCRYLYINPTVERHSGIPASAFINKTIVEFGAPDALIELWRTNIHKAFATGQEQRLEFQTPSKTGAMIHYATRVVPEFAGDGSVQSVLAIARDISDYVRILQEREQAEELLRQSEMRLRLALKAAKFGTWECNFVTGELFQSDISDIYGLEPGQTHKTYEEWKAQVHPMDRNWMQAEFDRAVQAAGEFSFEFRIIRLDGTVRWTLSTGAVVQNKAGQSIYAYGIAADITDRKLAEVEQKAQQAFLRQVIDVVPNVIFVKDKTGRFLIVNQAGASIHGTTVEAMLGKRETEFNPHFSAKQLQEFLAVNQRVMETRRAHTDLSEAIVTASGEIHWYQTVISPLIDVNGSVIGIVGATTDVTMLKQTERALQQAKEAAEAANRAKSIFLANMSHELRTPLNVILGFAQVMCRDPLLTQQYRENLQIIHRSGDHLLNLINDVLDLSKIEAGHITLDESSIDLIDLLRSLQQMFCQPAETKGLQFLLELSSNLPQYVTVDANKLKQVLINLLGNAIKFTKQGEVALEVRMMESALLSPLSPLSLYFKVQDTGVGIAPAELETIFSAFVQTQAGKISPDGTGLGLTISRKFVQMMGGDLTVQSRLGQGSTFTFTIPVHLAQCADTSVMPSCCQVIELAPDQPTYRILVVDDQPENRKLLVRLLTQIGLEVQEAANGQEAITQWQQWHPHLIYMDIRLPLLNGYETTQRIRTAPDGHMPVIIALTAQASKGDRALALSSGCNDYLTKPFRAEVLFSKMAEHLGLKYLYATEPVVASEHDPSPVSRKLRSSDLLVMPSDWIVALRRAAQLCDDSSIEHLIEQIPVEYTSLIKGLCQLVQTYSFKQIVVLTLSGASDDHA